MYLCAIFDQFCIDRDWYVGLALHGGSKIPNNLTTYCLTRHCIMILCDAWCYYFLYWPDSTLPEVHYNEKQWGHSLCCFENHSSVPPTAQKNLLKDEVTCHTKADGFLPLHLKKVGSHIIFKVLWIMRAAAADRTEASNCCFYLGSKPCLSNPAGTTVTGGEKQEYRILASVVRLIGFEIEKPFVLLNFCHPGWPPSPQPARMTTQLWCSAAGVTMQPELPKNCFLLRAEHLVVRFSCLISCADVCEVDSLSGFFFLFFF